MSCQEVPAVRRFCERQCAHTPLCATQVCSLGLNPVWAQRCAISLRPVGTSTTDRQLKAWLGKLYLEVSRCVLGQYDLC